MDYRLLLEAKVPTFFAPFSAVFFLPGEKKDTGVPAAALREKQRQGPRQNACGFRVRKEGAGTYSPR